MDDDMSDFASHQPRVRQQQQENVASNARKRVRGKAQTWEKQLNIASDLDFCNWLKTYGELALTLDAFT